MQHRLSVFLRKEVQELIDAFAACFSVKVTFFSADMEELSVGLKNPGSSYCRHVQNDLKLLYQCHAMDREMCRRAAAYDKSVHYHCHAGLIEAILPIKLEGKTIGTMMMGQIRDTATPPASILGAWKAREGSVDGLLSAWSKLDLFDESRLKNMFRLFTMLVQYVISQNYVMLREGMLIERVLRYVDEHIRSPVSLSKAAKSLGRSESAIAHALRKKLDLTFTRLVSPSTFVAAVRTESSTV